MFFLSAASDTNPQIAFETAQQEVALLRQQVLVLTQLLHDRDRGDRGDRGGASVGTSAPPLPLISEPLSLPHPLQSAPSTTPGNEHLTNKLDKMQL